MPPVRTTDPTIVAACLAAAALADSLCTAAKLARTTRSPLWSSGVATSMARLVIFSFIRPAPSAIAQSCYLPVHRARRKLFSTAVASQAALRQRPALRPSGRHKDLESHAVRSD